MATAKAKSETAQIDIIEVERERAVFHLLGTTPFVFNAMSQKARQELLMPRGKKSPVERAQTLKHEPIKEYRASVYRSRAGETELMFLPSAFKGAMASAAIDIPGAAKAQIGRLVWVTGQEVAMYGVPQLLMSVVRSSDMARTPDIRTRAILPAWAARIEVTYTVPLIKGQMVARLLAAAGMIIGVGDGRSEKGKLNYGSFEIVSPENPVYQQVIREGGRDAQIAALESPAAFDLETETLWSWFDDELSARKLRGVA